ncbi:MAG TPA: efflux RND transporter periplasmic adaptor subunit [Dokdonella sp.]|uniref:efflux RND transporter periplasmic adaptor subunit n=1 Tax=Dokdonella sp. TaxID=2291710 RepID=UPI0025BCEE94|nr:efflux RND transporter periplasmic adaptor subunit [Dokdonella sp.]MBX3690946.1 efflux RND transporter periplasmic adaptor subunit [Dokdonella sp.]MCW5566789.1 efflux RND transporter periplasmic adaptor subunit [Dokdonella sp.]HNR92909.1 efflux RND transporter periplasmic adaptor subunit [Dokdonella sp.]
MNARPPLLCTLAAGLATVLAGCSTGTASPSADKEKPAGQPVEVARVERGELTAHYAATATLEAEREATLVAEVPGTVLEIVVEEGQRVRKGQLLARLDADRSRLQLREAEADLQRRRNDVERGEQLLARKLIPATQHDQAVSDYAMRRADVGLARVNVGKAEIRAPFDGTVTRRWVKRGQLLAHNAPVFDVADFTDLRADLRVPERDASALAANQPVRFTADALGTREFAARIERVAPVVDRSSGTVGVTVRIDNRDLALRPGQFARMDIAFRHFDDTVLMPKAAVLGSRNAAVAYVIRDGKAVRTPIRLGYENGARVQVLEGVEAGSEVVVSGHAALSDGTAVHVLPAIDTTAAVRNLAALGGKRS